MAQSLDGDDDPLAQMESLLTCSICLETFSEPRTLPCFHSFCKPCLEKFVTNQRNKSPEKKIEEFNCPSCRSIFVLKTDEEVTGMCSSHFIRNMLDVLSIQRQAKTKAAKCSTFQCEKDAASRCMKCELFLCEACLKFHANWPAFAKHSVLSISELTEGIAENQVKLTGPRSRCNKHESKLLKFYCQTCKELICRYCMDFDHDKQNHSCLLVQDVADKKKEALKTNVHALEGEQNKQSEALQAVKEVTQCLKVNFELAKDEVSRHKQEVLDDFTQKLEQNFQEIINELDQKYNEGYDSLAKQSVAMKLQLDKVESSLDFSKNLLERGSQEDILSSQAMIQQTVETLEKERTQPTKPVHDGNIKYKRKPIRNENSIFANLLGQVENWRENTIVGEDIEYNEKFLGSGEISTEVKKSPEKIDTEEVIGYDNWKNGNGGENTIVGKDIEYNKKFFGSGEISTGVEKSPEKIETGQVIGYDYWKNAAERAIQGASQAKGEVDRNHRRTLSTLLTSRDYQKDNKSVQKEETRMKFVDEHVAVDSNFVNTLPSKDERLSDRGTGWRKKGRNRR